MSAVPGLRGSLVSASLVDRRLSGFRTSVVSADVASVRRGINAVGPASSLRAMLESAAGPLCQLLGFLPPVDVDWRTGTVAATLRGAAAEPAPSLAALLVTTWCYPIESSWRAGVVEARQRSAEWCLLFNGTRLGIVDAQRVYLQRHIEIDLEIALDDDRDDHAGLAVLRLLASAAALLGRDAQGFSPLRRLIEESDRLAVAVCQSLRTGVLSASRDVLGALVERPPRPPIDHAFEQALTIVYRLLFLFFAEARGLVPVWHPVYRGSYSLHALRRLAERGTAAGLWDALRASSRLAHAGCRLGTLRVTPFNGRLFAPARTPLAERLDLDDGAARDALLALATAPTAEGGRRDIDYAELGVEQLGAVYETLLDYRPRTSTRAGPRRARVEVTLEAGSGVRKATGTFYTPQVLTRYLVSRALGPLVRGASPARILDLRVLDPAMGSGAFLVAACEFLARAYESALVEHGDCHTSDIGPAERASIRRTVAERCLYGVDLNPVAVQLARLSLWLATLAAERPLSFLDHHLRTGNSLLGTWLGSLRHPPHVHRSGRRPLPLFEDEAATVAMREVVPVRFALATGPNDTLEQVRTKEKTLAELDREDSVITRWRRLADLWCASWFGTGRTAPAVFRVLADTVLTGAGALPDHVAAPVLQQARAEADARRFFHWELEFPEAFFDKTGARLPAAGFDAVIGNPPWEMMRADRASEDARDRIRHEAASSVRFARDTGVYEASTVGHANQYQLFVERAISLTRRGGRLGLVVPSGLITDLGSAPVRRLLFSRCDVEELIGFENRRGLFPIHRSVRFLLLSASAGTPTQEIRCRFGEEDPAILDAPDDEVTHRVRVTPALLERLTGTDFALPDFRSPMDVVIAERAAALFAPLGSDAGWAARFGRELNATDDRHHFVTNGRGLPVVEGKHLSPFSVRLDDSSLRIPAGTAAQLLGRRHARPRLAYRDVASATNRLTLIAAILPRGLVSTHTLFCLRTPLPLRDQYFLCGLFNSFVLNYLVRMRVTTHVTTGIVERLPVPTRIQAGFSFAEIATLARTLSREPNEGARAHLQAVVARLYQLSSDEFAHVLTTFPLIPRDEREAAMRAYAGNPAEAGSSRTRTDAR